MKGLLRSPYFIILGIALIIRIFFLLYALSKGEDSFFLFDSYRYMNLGTHLFEDGIYAENISTPLFESIFTPPGSPVIFYFLNSLGGIALIIFAQIMAQLVTCYFLIKIIEFVFTTKNIRLVFIGGFLFAFDIPTIVLGNVVMTETFFTLFLTLSIYHLIRFLIEEKPRLLTYSSLLMGGAVLFRPILIYFPIILTLLFLILFLNEKKKLISSLAYLLIPFYLMAGSWVLRNYLKHDSIFFSYQGDFNLFYFQAASIYSQENQISLMDARVKLMDELKSNFSGKTKIDQVEFYKLAGENARSIILSHPTVFFKNMVKANGNLLLRPIRDYLKINLGSKELFHTRSKNNSMMINFLTYWQVLVSVIFLFFLPFGFLYFYLTNQKIFWLFTVFLGYFLLVCSGPEVEARFRVPLIPELIILAIGGFSYLNAKFFTKKDIASTDNSTFVP